MGLPARPQPAFRTRSCYWSLLKQGVVKIDVVGALRGIPRISGMGASFRDDMGNFLLFTHLAKTSCHEEPIQGSGDGSHTSADPVVYYHRSHAVMRSDCDSVPDIPDAVPVHRDSVSEFEC
ncbi:hypothetical protein IFM89_022449 [Coptis chinensis]|uniref:Uncharacterized protein n=1 Tax=Coptis chinensis TaxID=261450 RepID=A0A835I2J6_9MAGN|nr:hypothetical protein IFM89_022449 [Coptis chinensis]